MTTRLRLSTQLGEVMFRKTLDVASGEKSKSEALGVGEEEFAPWPIGVLAWRAQIGEGWPGL